MTMASSQLFPPIADWTKAENYSIPAGTNLKRWSWEFLRRNRFYRHHANLMLGLPIEWQLKTSSPWATSYDPVDEVKSSSAREAQAAVSEMLDTTIPAFTSERFTQGLRIAPLKLFRNIWGVNFAFSAEQSFEDVCLSRELTSDELQRVCQFCSVRTRRKRIPPLKFYSFEGSIFTHSSLKTDQAVSERDFARSQLKRIRLAPNEVLVRFYLNDRTELQIRNTKKKLRELREKYLETVQKNALIVLPRGAAEQASLEGFDRRRPVQDNFHLILRIYDAVDALQFEYETLCDAHHGEPRALDPLNKKNIDDIASALNERSKFFNEAKRRFLVQIQTDNKDDVKKSDKLTSSFDASASNWFEDAKWYVERGGYLTIAHSKKKELNEPTNEPVSTQTLIP
jgi:hypothetical protein